MTCPPVLFICQSPKNGDAHWRVTRPAARLAAAGVAARVCWLDTDHLPVESVAGRVVVLQRVIMRSQEAASAWVRQLRAAGALAVVFELDDDELSGAHIDHFEATQPLSAAHRAELERQREALRWTLEACDGATVSTEPLAEVVRTYTSKPVITVPNAIDVEWFRERLIPRAPWADCLTIGWAGWRRPDADLAPMAEAWARIARRYPAVRFVVAGWQADAIYRQDIDLERIIRVPIVPIEQYPPIHQVDIGCCAVADSPFSRCKTPIKAWEYTRAFAAVVGTPTLYGGCLQDARGLLAETVDQWEEALAHLIDHPFERELAIDRMADHIRRYHSLDTQVHRWESAFRTIVDSVSDTIKVQNASA